MSRTNVTSVSIPVALLATILALGCGEVPKSVTGVAGPTALFMKPTCPGHPSCKDDPPAPAGDATADLTGDITTAASQDVVISKDSKNHLAGSGAGPDFSIVDALALFAAAGSPTPAALGACVTDPQGLDPATVQRLIDRLTDASQARTFRFSIDRKDPSNVTGLINQSWTDDGDGNAYRTRVIGAVVTVLGDTYRYTGGDIVTWDTSTNDKLVCPNGGEVTLSLHR